MAFSVLVDANVLLDFTLKSSNYKSARELLLLIASRKINACITPSILHILGYWLTKAYGGGKAKKILLELLASVQVIDASHETALAALNSQMPDIEDALQYYTALQHQLDCCISGDKQLKKKAIASLPVYTIEEFLNSRRQE